MPVSAVSWTVTLFTPARMTFLAASTGHTHVSHTKKVDSNSAVRRQAYNSQIHSILLDAKEDCPPGEQPKWTSVSKADRSSTPEASEKK